MAHYPLVFLFGALSGCGIATFSVGAAQTSYWSPEDRQGTMLAVYAGLGKQFAGIFTLLVPVARRARPDGCVPRVVWLPRLRDVRLPHRRRSPFFQLRKQGLEAEQRSNGPKRGARSCSRAGTRWRRSCSGLGSASPTRRCSGSSRHTCRRPSAARQGWSADSARSAAAIPPILRALRRSAGAAGYANGFVVFFVPRDRLDRPLGELYRTRVVPTPDGLVPSDD